MRHGETLFRQIREARRSRRLSLRAVAPTVGIDPTHWGKLEKGDRPGASADSLARMAEAIGMRLVLVPATDPIRPVTLPGPPPEPERTRHLASPTVRRIMERVRSARESLGLSQAQAASRAGVEKSTWGNLERGHHQGRSVGVDRIAAAASAVGLRLDAFDATGAAMADLGADEVYAILSLIRWYRSRAPRFPVVLESALGKLEQATESTERNAA